MRKAVNDVGMTDLQFKSWLQQLVNRLKDINNADDKNEIHKKIEELVKEFENTLKN